MEDWRDETVVYFKEKLEEIVGRIVDNQDDEKLTGKEVIFTGADGNIVKKYYGEITDGSAGFLENSIREAIEEFGDSISNEQKIAVMMKVIEEMTA